MAHLNWQQGDRSNPKGNQPWIFTGRTDAPTRTASSPITDGRWHKRPALMAGDRHKSHLWRKQVSGQHSHRQDIRHTGRCLQLPVFSSPNACTITWGGPSNQETWIGTVAAWSTSLGLYSCLEWGRAGGIWDAGKGRGWEKQFSVKGGKEGGREGGKEGRKDVSRCLKLFSKEVKLTREMLSGHARKPWFHLLRLEAGAGSPVVKALHFQHRRHGFNSWAARFPMLPSDQKPQQ